MLPLTLRRSLTAMFAALWFCSVVIAAEPAPTVPAATNVEALRAQLTAQVTAPRFSGALWGVKVVSLDSGQTLFEHHADRPLSPASNCKLFTAALALDQLGRDYRIVTPLFATARPDAAGTLAGDLIVSGRGDPSWKARGGASRTLFDALEPLVSAIAAAGVRHITGDLVADATWIRGTPNGAGWTADDLMDDYGAEISALSLDDNFADLRVIPAATAGQPCRLELVQPLTGLVLDNRTTTAAAGSARRIERVRLFGENVVHLSGELPVGDREEIVDVTVPRPAQWFAVAFKEALARRGIRVDSAARSRRWPDEPAVTTASVKLGEISSPPLHELITALMKPSQNLETDLIFAHLGELRRTAETPARRTSDQLAVAALQEFLRQHSLPAEEVRFEEGSGLSRNNLATANATVALLRFMAAHARAKDFADSLPIAGVDGTLRRRLKGTPAEGNLRAKTGTLRYANSLSGYVTTAAGERLAFSLMLNRNTAAGRSSTAELDDLAMALARFAGRSGATKP